MWQLRFHDGTLVVEGARVSELPPGFVHDDRVGWPRGPAWLYAETVLLAQRDGREVEDRARNYQPLQNLNHLCERTPRDYQSEAVQAWVDAGSRGAVVLPT